MNLTKMKKATVWLAVFGFAAAALVSVASGKMLARWAVAAQEVKRERPKVVSLVDSVEVSKVEVKNRGGGREWIHIEVKNISELPIVAVTLTFGSRSLIKDGATHSDEPKIILPPGGKTEFFTALSNVEEGEDIEVSGVIFADETEAGKDKSVKRMREIREAEKAKRNPKKEGQK